MCKGKVAFLALVGLVGFCSLLPLAYADSYGYYAVGTFQFNANSISGNAGGICSGDCAPWGDLAVLNVTFSSSVVGYQESSSCSNGECETELIGQLGVGTLTADISVGYPSQVYDLVADSLGGSFDTHFCSGGSCNTYRPETEFSLNFAGSWNNGWSSTGTIQLECFQKYGCSAGSGAGELDTFVPESSTFILLTSGIASLRCAFRRSAGSRSH